MSDADAPRPRDEIDLLAEIGHELATPLSIALGFAGQLAADAEDDAARATATAVQRNIDIALQLLATYRDAQRDEDDVLTLELAWVDVGSLVTETVVDLRVVTGGREVAVEAPQEGMEALVDPSRIRQALYNLLSNATRHTPEDTAVHVRVWPDGDSAVIEVADEGDGIAPELAPRIFQRHTRGDHDAGGLGLGLYVARRIAEAHQGTLELVEADGGGAVFRFRVPIGER